MLLRTGILWLLLVFGAVSCASLSIFQEGQDSFDQGLALFNQGHYNEAIPYFQVATERNPNFAQAYFYLGRSMISLRRWRDAIPPLRTAHRLAPDAAKQEIFDVLLDAFFAVALDGSNRPAPSSRRPFQ